jgi:Asp-tRNA(Asn)/Glu-tRNA(Gln) amidotransferase B subunit
VRLVRAHLEKEDADKSLHEDFMVKTALTLNRAGTRWRS